MRDRFVNIGQLDRFVDVGDDADALSLSEINDAIAIVTRDRQLADHLQWFGWFCDTSNIGYRNIDSSLEQTATFASSR